MSAHGTGSARGGPNLVAWRREQDERKERGFGGRRVQVGLVVSCITMRP